MSQIKRSRVLISMLQVRLMLLSVAYLLALALILGAVLFWPLARRVEDPNIGAAEQAVAAAELLALHARFWPVFAVVAATFVAHQLIVSHRIAGPLYRIRQVLRSMARGEPPHQVRLRKRDLLTEEADELNALLDASRERLDGACDALARASTAATNLTRSGAHSPAEGAELSTALTLLSTALARFDLTRSSSSTDAPYGDDQGPPPALPGGAARSSVTPADVRSTPARGERRS